MQKMMMMMTMIMMMMMMMMLMMTRRVVSVVQTLAEDELWVMLGEHNITSDTETNLTLRLEVDRIEVHTNKLGNPDQVDIALIKVKEVIDLNIYTPICLPEAGFNVRRGHVILAG